MWAANCRPHSLKEDDDVSAITAVNKCPYGTLSAMHTTLKNMATSMGFSPPDWLL